MSPRLPAIAMDAAAFSRHRPKKRKNPPMKLPLCSERKVYRKNSARIPVGTGPNVFVGAFADVNPSTRKRFLSFSLAWQPW